MGKYLFIFFLCILLAPKTICQDYFFDYKLFKDIVSDSLEGKVKNYAFALSLKGPSPAIMASDYGGDPKEKIMGQIGCGDLFDLGTAINIGSVSKIVTTAAVLRAIEKTPGLNLDLKMKDYIPYRWRDVLHPDYADVTIRLLLQHRAGFNRVGDNKLPTRTYLSQPLGICSGNEENPIYCKVGVKNYSNYSMLMFQIMLGYMISPQKMAAIESSLNDHTDESYDQSILKELSDIYYYYVQDSVLRPNLIYSDCNTASVDCYGLIYKSENDTDPGLLLPDSRYSYCSAGGWVMSVEHLLLFLNTLKYSDKIISADSYKLMENADLPYKSLGYYFYDETDEGICFHHGGSNTQNGRSCRAMAMNFPNGMEAAGLINSKSSFFSPEWKMRDLFIKAYNESCCPSSVYVLTNVGLESWKLKNIKAKEAIISQSKVVVNPGDNIHFRAGKSISLKPGFYAKEGCTFRAYPGACKEGDGGIGGFENAILNEPFSESEESFFVETPSVPEAENIQGSPKEESLRVYPNPFSRSIQISYHLEKTGSVVLTLYTQEGKEVVSLLAESDKPAGSYRSTFDLSALPNGMYIYKFKNGGKTQTGHLFKQ